MWQSTLARELLEIKIARHATAKQVCGNQPLEKIAWQTNCVTNKLIYYIKEQKTRGQEIGRAINEMQKVKQII
ncbi:MAG: hypothetical protein RR416_00490 [Clostridia bacterium]